MKYFILPFIITSLVVYANKNALLSRLLQTRGVFKVQTVILEFFLFLHTKSICLRKKRGAGQFRN